MVLQGKVLKYGDNIDTGEIISGEYLQTLDPKILAAHAMEHIDPDFRSKVCPGDIIVAGKYFGCGSSREGAALALKASGISAIVALSFGRIHFRNSINLGLPVIECPDASKIPDGCHITIDLSSGTIRIHETAEILYCSVYPKFIMDIIESGGLIQYKQRKSTPDAGNC